MYIFIFFFFKQKTAYEMRISDWSSDVCSSDLRGVEGGIAADERHVAQAEAEHAARRDCHVARLLRLVCPPVPVAADLQCLRVGVGEVVSQERGVRRSEERRGGKEWVSTCRSWWSPWH